MDKSPEMRKYFYSFINVLLFLELFNCTGDPVKPVYNNPIDPDNDEYTLPEITELIGLTNNAVLNQNNFTLSWTGSSTELQYWVSLTGSALDGHGEGVWVALDSTTNISADYLNEGDHQLKVRAQYSADHEDVFHDSLDFVVDALPENSLWLYPTRVAADVNQTFSIYVRTDEWDQNFRSGSLSLTFDPDVLTFDTASLEVSGANSIIEINPGQLPEGLLQIDFSILTSDIFTPVGTVDVLKLDFVAGSTFQEANITLLGESQLRTMENRAVTIGNLENSQSYTILVEKALTE